MNLRTVKQFTTHASKSIRELAGGYLKLTEALDAANAEIAELKLALKCWQEGSDDAARHYYTPDVPLDVKAQTREESANTNPFELNTFAGWRMVGRSVTAGEKSNQRDFAGQALFTRAQTSPLNPSQTSFRHLLEAVKQYGIDVYEDKYDMNKIWFRSDGHKKMGIGLDTLAGFTNAEAFIAWYLQRRKPSETTCPREPWVEFKPKVSESLGVAMGWQDHEDPDIEYPEGFDPYFDNVGDR